MPYDFDGTWYDDPYNNPDDPDRPLSPWEQAHGAHPYDPASPDSAPNAFDQATEDYYFNLPQTSRDEHPQTNWYDPGSYNWLLNDPAPPTPGPGPGPGPGPDPTPDPTPTPSPTGGGDPISWGDGGLPMGPLVQGFPGTFQAPEFGVAAKRLSDLIGPAPAFTPPDIPTIDPFSYEDYTPTTGAHVFGDPSFGFRKHIGEDALLKNRAARGLLRSGGTLKDLLAYNQNFASQEFGNVDARRFRDYQTGRGNALEGWRANTDTTLRRSGMDQDRARAMYEPQLFEWTRKGDLMTRAEDKARDDAFQEFQTDYDIFRNTQRDVFDRLKWASEFGLDAATR